MRDKTILVIEKDKKLQEEINKALKDAGFKVWITGNGSAVCGPLSHLSPDGIILDGNITDTDGKLISSKVREENQSVPLIAMTEDPQELEFVIHLERGADDCMLKPVRTKELVSRMRSLLRRKQQAPGAEKDFSSGLISNGSLKIDLLNHKVYLEEAELDMAIKELALLIFFALNQNRSFTREGLLEAVMEEGEERSFRTIDVLISRLRRKIEPNPRRPAYIKTVRGMGYMMRSLPAAGREE